MAESPPSSAASSHFDPKNEYGGEWGRGNDKYKDDSLEERLGILIERDELQFVSEEGERNTSISVTSFRFCSHPNPNPNS